MRRGKTRIVFGILMILTQCISLAGNAKAGVGIQFSMDTLATLAFDLGFILSYFFVGIVGVILLVSGIVAYVKSGKSK